MQKRKLQKTTFWKSKSCFDKKEKKKSIKYMYIFSHDKLIFY